VSAPAIELKGISKAFGPVQANKDISIRVMPGTIHGIIGENGAGKSTLMSILYGFYKADPDALIENIGVGMQQRVEILKALYRKADILILDEPTGVLTPAEADHLFRILDGLKAQGKTIILITHKLREIMDVTDTVSVMRRGEMTATVKTSETSPAELAELMVGRKVLLRVDKVPANPGEEVLSVKDLRVTDEKGVERVKGISLTGWVKT